MKIDNKKCYCFEGLLRSYIFSIRNIKSDWLVVYLQKSAQITALLLLLLLFCCSQSMKLWFQVHIQWKNKIDKLICMKSEFRCGKNQMIIDKLKVFRWQIKVVTVTESFSFICCTCLEFVFFFFLKSCARAHFFSLAAHVRTQLSSFLISPCFSLCFASFTSLSYSHLFP